MRYSVQPRDQIFIKDYGLLCFSKNKGKNFGKNRSQNLNGKCSPGMLATRQNFLILLKNLLQFKLVKLKTTLQIE